jgi:hypothetical protein
MKIIIRMCLCGLTVLSCCHPSEKAERLNVQLEMVYRDMEIQFPGQFVVERQCFILFDPFVTSECVKVLDRETGEKTVGFLNTGQGPDEFNMPWCGYSANDTLTIFDLNIKKKIECNLDSLSKGKASVHPIRFPHDHVLQLARLGTNRYAAGIFDSQTPFVLMQDDEIIHEFGKYPVEGVVTNISDRFQGTILYNEERHVLAYATFETPYLSLYQQEGNVFMQLWESRFANAHYSISNDQLRWDNDQPAGIHEFAFTRDYIACLVKEMRLNKSSGRTKEHMAGTIYLYKYDGELVKILELDIPSVRIGATTDSNVVYLISLGEEYCLTKLDLQKYNL